MIALSPGDSLYLAPCTLCCWTQWGAGNKDPANICVKEPVNCSMKLIRRMRQRMRTSFLGTRRIAGNEEMESKEGRTKA